MSACVVCKAASRRQLCRSCFTRLLAIWKIEPIAVHCPHCGNSPLEFSWFERLFPRLAREWNHAWLLLIIYSEEGCHRCESSTTAKARVFQLRIRDDWLSAPIV